jgi:hypothetical protein
MSAFSFRLALIALLRAPTPPVGVHASDGGAIAFDRDTAMWLATLPLGCIDKLHDPPRSRGYVYESTVTLHPDFQKTRAFYGCFDWHSSVNSTWTLVKILRTHPDLPIARLIREKLNEHLSEEAIKGELEFFNEEGNRSFERPYGWVWALRLQAELSAWNDPDAKKWAAHLTPLSNLFLERMPGSVHPAGPDRPGRAGRARAPIHHRGRALSGCEV